MDLMPIYAYIYYFNILFAIIVQKGENLNVIFSFKSVFRTGLVLMIEKMALMMMNSFLGGIIYVFFYQLK